MLTSEFPCTIRSVSCTTRPPRTNEVDGKDYFFLTKEAFEAKIAAGDFLEHAEVFGNHYGTARGFVTEQQKKGKHVILVLDTQGALQLKGRLAATFIFIAPPSMEELRNRLMKRRTESPQLIDERLAWARHELEKASQYDYQIVNDHLDTAYTVLKSILIAEEHKNRR